MPYLIDDTSTLPNALHGEYSSGDYPSGKRPYHSIQSAEYLIFLLLGKHLRRLYWTLVKLDVTGGTRGQRLRLWPWT